MVFSVVENNILETSRKNGSTLSRRRSDTMEKASGKLETRFDRSHEPFLRCDWGKEGRAISSKLDSLRSVLAGLWIFTEKKKKKLNHDLEIEAKFRNRRLPTHFVNVTRFWESNVIRLSLRNGIRYLFNFLSFVNTKESLSSHTIITSWFIPTRKIESRINLIKRIREIVFTIENRKVRSCFSRTLYPLLF